MIITFIIDNLHVLAEKLKSKEEEESDGKPRPRSERSVDEIIASLRAQSSGARTYVLSHIKIILYAVDHFHFTQGCS